MILRPSKIFVSFHQLRHYFQTKVTELVATGHQQPSTVVTQLKNYSTTQQTIVSFADIQRTFVKRVHYPQQQPNIHNENLLNVIQRHFPVAKVFSQPTLHGRSVMWANASKQQCRTIVSGFGGGGGGGSVFFSYGLPRSAMVGLGRNNGFGGTARQFSTTKTPLSVFQQTAQQPNVIAHISSRIFSPAGTKMTQPTVAEEKPKFVPFYSSQKDESSSDEEEDEEESKYTDKYHFVRVFENTTKGMADLLNTQETEKALAAHVADMCRSNKRKMGKKSDSIVRHDDISCLRHIKQAKRKHNGTIISRLSRRPPDRTTHVYLLFDLNPDPFSSDWTTQGLESSFVDSLEAMARSYRVRIHEMLAILDDLRFSGKKFRVVARHAELRIYFPSRDTLHSEVEAIAYLNRLGVQINRAFYTIVVERAYVDPVVQKDYFKDLHLFLDGTDSLMQSRSSLFHRSFMHM
ncbi:hypothetical protein MFLAVUS_002715 [Mucor flavus]|uniref:Uncharacterized protein n=1 Tax=Mucor flavus TaxID=439312 RepID=A0ABP9YR14_9FUNG